jgi:hypothetical protein
MRTREKERLSSASEEGDVLVLPEEDLDDRRSFLRRAGKIALGAATVAVVGIRGEKPAHAQIGSYGCCFLAYNKFCTAWEWAHCGYCNSSTNEFGNPTGKWWWSCRQTSTQFRFCGECSDHNCSYTYKYSESYGKLCCQSC